MSPPTPLPEHRFISVVMPVYNTELYVAEAISSILAQTYSHFEFIIVDDGSTDGSAGIVREFAARDARIRPLYLAHSGRARAANIGVAAAKGDLIARMDADDIALPQRFAIQLEWMRQQDLDICGSCVKAFGESQVLIWFPQSHPAIQHELLFGFGLMQGTTIVRAAILKDHPHDEQTHFEDYELLTRLAPLYRTGNVSQVLLKYRTHERQSHVLESEAFRQDRLKFARRYFRTLFPHATAMDCDALAFVVGKDPFPSLLHLRKAGNWLIRLARVPDELLRQRMAMRWLGACHKSAGLGLGCYRVYQQIAPQFGVPTEKDAHKLWLACALRLRPESKVRSILRKFSRTH